MRDGYVARWQGREYEASPDGDDVRLYQPEPGEGFEEVRAGPLRAGWCRRPRSTSWRTCAPPAPGKGEPFIVLGRARRLAAGGVHRRAGPVAEALGLEEFDFGVYQGWAPAAEVTDLREHRRLKPRS